MADDNSLPFHRKYRPTTISTYIGNDKLKDSIMKSLKNGNRPQVMTFYGDSGCGKTTMARLVAKEYLCEDRNEETGACNSCPNCQALDEYITTGVTDNMQYVREVDIASESGKRDLDAIVEDMMLPSFDWKVYILDECHEASIGAQNRLLKIVE